LATRTSTSTGPGFEGLNARLPVQPGNSDLCFVWPGPIEEAVARLEQHGVPIEAGPRIGNGPRGQMTSVYFRDPDGQERKSSSHRVDVWSQAISPLVWGPAP
jgi:catechol 2,3-dioxygenase-like lactoylglutathione lyase family enzyme